MDIYSCSGVIKNYQYSISKDVDKKIVYAILLKGDKLHIIDFIIEKNDIINLEVSENSIFAISLHSNASIAYSWKIENINDVSVIKYRNKEIIRPKTHDNKIGISSRRQNFYFEALKKGTSMIVMEYSHNREKNNENYRFFISVNIT